MKWQNTAMNINHRRILAKVLNTLVVATACGTHIIIGLMGFGDLPLALSSTVILTVTSVLMYLFYDLDKPGLAGVFFAFNLLLPMGAPVFRLFGTDFIDGQIETLVITFPLIMLIIWNYRISATIASSRDGIQ